MQLIAQGHRDDDGAGNRRPHHPPAKSTRVEALVWPGPGSPGALACELDEVKLPALCQAAEVVQPRQVVTVVWEPGGLVFVEGVER